MADHDTDPRRGRALILGLGNTILRDDGAGVYAARLCRDLLTPDDCIDIEEAELGGFGLLDLLDGYHAAVIIDAITVTQTPPGTVHVFDADHFTPTARLATSHQVSLPIALKLAAELGRRPPGSVIVVGIKAEDPYSFDEACSPAVAAHLDEAAATAVEQARAALSAAPRLDACR